MPAGSVSRHAGSLLAVVHTDVGAGGGGVAACDVVTGGGVVGAAVGTVLFTGVSKSYERGDVPKQTRFAGTDWETGHHSQHHSDSPRLVTSGPVCINCK